MNRLIRFEVREHSEGNWKCFGRFATVDEARAFADSIDAKRKWAHIYNPHEPRWPNDLVGTEYFRVPSHGTSNKS